MIQFAFIDEFPKQISDPKVTVHEHDSRIRFTCDFEIETILPANKYNVTWYSVTGREAPKVIEVDQLEGNQTKSYLQNTNTLATRPNYKFCLNQNVSIS